MSDESLEGLRTRIAAQDRIVLDAVNERLRLVAELRRHKERQAIGFHDLEQERRLLERLVNDNDGPLSPDGVRALFEEILALVKRELGELG
ncbi:MAG TPA: chorismate mutase [Gaiellaceae bacterium]|nr:chorismate mutase [Gaiellaceae bacterium]